jgi:hypothetical protein
VGFVGTEIKNSRAEVTDYESEPRCGLCRFGQELFYRARAKGRRRARHFLGVDRIHLAGLIATVQESELKAALLTRRAKLAEQIKSLTRQLKACDTMLAGLDDGDLTAPTDAEVSAVLGQNSPAPASIAAVLPPPAAPAVPPVPPPPPKIGPTPEELEQLTALSQSQRRGRRMALVEVAIARCDDHFSLHDIMKVLKSEFH